MTTVENPAPTFLWLELTGKCQLACTHCATDSSPDGTHGSMTVRDWERVIDEAADLGVRQVQFVGGEPTLHPGLPELVRHALSRALDVEVFSNLVHVTDELWELFRLPGVSLATSYYSDDPEQHAAITGRPVHARTKANIARALALGVVVRAGVIDLGAGQRVEQARAELTGLGVPAIGYDRVRGIGRGARDHDVRDHGAAARGGPADQLCGHCGDGIASVGPDGAVRPCLFSRWVDPVGNVRSGPLGAIGAGLPAARAALVAQGMPTPTAADGGGDCTPCSPQGNCYPIHCEPRT